MKKILTLCLAALLLLTSIPLSACKNNEEDTPQETTTKVSIVKDAASEYTIIRPQSAGRTSPVREAALLMRDLIKNATGADLTRADDYYQQSDPAAAEAVKTSKEILIGETNRPESTAAMEGLAFNEFVIRLVGSKIVIVGACDAATLQAVKYFGDNYISADSAELAIPADLSVKGTVDMSTSMVHNTEYTSMGSKVLLAFNNRYLNGGNLLDTEFWDAAEILEAYIDAYEQTGSEKILSYIQKITQSKFNANNTSVNWCASNPYNDDISWACIAFARLYLLTEEEDYLTIAKNNFDIMFARANNAPDVLGGGLWWKQDELNTKNSCIQCPASIAACLIGKATGDDSYYEKAKEVMEWEFANLFEPDTGKVYDCYHTKDHPDGEGKSTWASTYNQGTFIGACTLLHEKYGDDKYMEYAAAAAKYSMNSLGNKDGVLNCETGGGDLIGFKGILTRWLHCYAEYTQNLDILQWLQLNADTAYSNRTSKNFIWTNWAEPTNEDLSWNDDASDNGKYDIFGLSAAIALLFNCEPWW